MKDVIPITCLLLDIGGPLLTNGWNHNERRRVIDLAIEAKPNATDKLVYSVKDEATLILAGLS
jgi:hypothetical protein